MPGVFLLAPGPVFSDPNQQSIHSNATVTANGSGILTGYGTKEISLIVNVLASPTGTLPTLQYTLQEVDPGDLTTVFGQTVSTVVISSIGVYTVNIRATQGGVIKVSWVIGGTSSPTFTQVYSTLTSKSTTASSGIDGTGVEHPILVDSSARTVVSGAGTAGTPAGGVVSIQGAASGTAVPVSGTVTANVGTTGGLALDATLTAGNQTTRVTDGTNTAAVKAASTPAIATDPALVVAISPNNPIVASNPSVGTNNAVVPGSSTQVGGTDGTNLQAAHVFDADTGAGSQYVLGVGLRKAASGGSVEAGTSSDPIRIDPTGTTAQPVTDNGGSITVDTTQLPAALVGGRLDENVGAWLGSTAPTVGQKISANSVPVVLASDQSAIPVTDNGGSITVDGTVTAIVASTGTVGAAIPASATEIGVSDGTNLRVPRAFDTDTGGGTEYVLGATLRKAASGGSVEAGTSTDPLRVDPTGTTTQPVSAVSLPLPTGAATEATLSTRLADATFTGRINTLGQKTSANSTPVVLASDQSAIPVTDNAGSLTIDTTQLPAALVGGRLDENVGAWLGSTAPTVGSKTSANSVPVVIASDQGAVAISAASLPLPTGASTAANQTTLGNHTTKLNDGTNTAAVKAASTAAVAADPALVVAISPNNTITTSNASVGSNNAALPTSSTEIGGSDGTNLQAVRVFDGDTGAGTQYVLGSILRKSASGGTVEAGTSSDPLRVDPTGTTTQPISASSLPLPTGAATEATLATRLADATFTGRINTLGQKTSANSTPVVLASDQTAIPVTDNGGTLTIDSTQLPAALVGGRLDENVGAWLGSTAPTVGQKTAANSVPTVLASDQSAIPVTDNAGSLTVDSTQLPAALVGGRLDENVGAWLGSTAPTVGQKTSANSVPVTLASDQSAVTTTNASVGTNNSAAPASSTQIGGTDGTNLQALRVEADGNISSNRTATGSLGISANIAVSSKGMANVAIQTTGTWGGSILFEATIDGTNFFAVRAAPVSGPDGVTPSTTATSNGQWFIACSGFVSVRVRTIVFFSGTVNVTLVASPHAGAVQQTNPSSTITSPNGAAAGLYAFLTAYGTLRTTGEPSALFNDTFDGTEIDTTTRWDPYVTGGATLVQNSGSLTFSTGTTASTGNVIVASSVSSKPRFPATGLSFQFYGFVIKIESGTPLSNVNRFWGIGTPGVPFTPVSPLYDAIGFELDTDSVLYATIRSAGIITFKVALSTDILSDGASHRFAIITRSDLTLWYLDNFEVPVMSSSFSAPSSFTLPIRMHCMNNFTTGPTSSPVFVAGALGAGDSANTSIALSDGKYSWRKATVSPASTTATVSDPALVVSMSPNSSPVKVIPTTDSYGNDNLSMVVDLMQLLVREQMISNLLLTKLVSSAGVDVLESELDSIETQGN